MERTKTGLLTDLQKRKGVERLVRAAGIDLSSENVEDQIAELLAAKAAPETAVPPLAAPVAPVTASGETQAVVTPYTAVEEAMRAQLASMQKQMDKLNDKLQQTEKEKQQ